MKLCRNLFDQIADGHIVEIGDRCPLEPFLDVLVLFLFQGQFDEHLLQFLVAKVDDELLETVVLQNFEAVNVQQTQHFPLAVLFDLKASNRIRNHWPINQPQATDSLRQDNQLVS